MAVTNKEIMAELGGSGMGFRPAGGADATSSATTRDALEAKTSIIE